MAHELIGPPHYLDSPAHPLVIIAVIAVIAAPFIFRLKPQSGWALAGGALVGLYHVMQPLVFPVLSDELQLILEDFLLSLGIVFIAYSVYLFNRPCKTDSG